MLLFLYVSWLLKYMQVSSCVSKEVKRGYSGSHIGLVYGPMKNYTCYTVSKQSSDRKPSSLTKL